jgi:hypothetical protein
MRKIFIIFTILVIMAAFTVNAQRYRGRYGGGYGGGQQQQQQQQQSGFGGQQQQQQQQQQFRGRG